MEDKMTDWNLSDKSLCICGHTKGSHCFRASKNRKAGCGCGCNKFIDTLAGDKLIEKEVEVE